LPFPSPAVDRKQGERPTAGSDQGKTNEAIVDYYLLRRDRKWDSGCIPKRQLARRCRSLEWEQPHFFSWRLAAASDAEWTHGNPAFVSLSTLTEAFSWTLPFRAIFGLTPDAMATLVWPCGVAKSHSHRTGRANA